MAKKTTSTKLDQDPAIEAKPYNRLGHTKPFRPPNLQKARVHIRAGKGGGAKSAGTNTHADLLRAAGATTAWTDFRGALPHVEGPKFTLFDMETANPTIGRYHPDLPEHQQCGTLDPHQMGRLLLYDILPLTEQGWTVLVDLGAQGEVPVLDFTEENDLSHLLGEDLVWHVPVGSLDSVGLAENLSQRSPATPIILYLLQKEPELEMVLGDPRARELLDNVLAQPNVLGALDFPDLRSAFSISSRTSRTLLDVPSYEKATLFERQICLTAFRRLQAAWKPAAEWLSC